MAKMIPALSAVRFDEMESNAERTFYKWCKDALPSTITVFYSVRWTVNEAGHLRDGEADFVICDELGGVLVVEVKGGGVSYSTRDGVWSTRDKHGTVHKLKRSPFAQARDSKYSLQKYLSSFAAWKRTFPKQLPQFGHAAIFPDLDSVEQFKSFESPLEIIGGRNDGGNALASWVRLALGSKNWNHLELGKGGVSALEAALAPQVQIRPLLRATIEDSEVQRIELSTNQSSVLSHLSRYNRAAITGGAGTGKTILAVEKARRLAEEGKKTLLLCYNRALAQLLAKSLAAVPNAAAETFHEFCGRMVRRAQQLTGLDLIAQIRQERPEWDLFDHVLPEALVRSADIVGVRFDAIVVDEGQDFRSDFWFPIELFLASEERGIFYIFFDENQRLYMDTLHLPVTTVPFVLTRNCRNATAIHDVAYKFYMGDPIDSSKIVGDVVVVEGLSLPGNARHIAKTITELIVSESVDPDDICVLVAGAPKLDYFDALEATTIPRSARWSSVSDGSANTSKEITLTTVYQFKGLESHIVFLWGMETASRSERAELFYVGASRAKTRLYIVLDASSPDYEELRSGPRQPNLRPSVIECNRGGGRARELP
jgi:hypothetical protein